MAIRQILVLTIFLHLHGLLAQINTKECGKTICCFQAPQGCASAGACDVLIAYNYNNVTDSLSVAVGSKHKWIAFGLANIKSDMDKVGGEFCIKDSSLPTLGAFLNAGYAPNFSPSKTGLSIRTSSFTNGGSICNYSRPSTPPSGSYMKDLNSPLFITVAYGSSGSGAIPSKHETNGFSSKEKIDFKKGCSAGGGFAASGGINKNVVVHGSLMIIAWMCFAAVGMFIARYTRPLAKDSKICGEKVWFQSHRICMTMALLLTIISFIIIFVHRKGWSEGAKAHPVTGCLTVLLAIIQPIMAVFRPHPGEDKRWVFNWAHRLVGFSALVLAAVTIFLGLDLVKVTKTVMIVWVVLVVLLIVTMEIILFFLAGKATAGYSPGDPKTSVEIEEDKTITIRKVMFILAFVALFALGFAAVGLVVKSG